MAGALLSGKPDEGPRRGFNQKRQDQFIEHLALTSDVSRSAEAAGIAVKVAYHARTNDPEFARRWSVALSEGYEHLEMEILRRLREGDQQTSDASKYDFANAIRLLSAHRENSARVPGEQRNVSAKEVRASIDRKVEEIRSRIQNEENRKAADL